MQLKRFALCAASLVLLAACGGDEGVGPGGIVTGSLSFTYAGGITGTYAASGSFPSNPTAHTNNFAGAEISPADGGTFVVGEVPVNATTYNYAIVFADRTTVGSSSLVNSCVDCGDFSFYFGKPTASSVAAQYCFLTSGTIDITSFSSTRVAGTFSGGSGTCSTPAGATSSFTVTSGTFDVPMVTGVIP